MYPEKHEISKKKICFSQANCLNHGWSVSLNTTVDEKNRHAFGCFCTDDGQLRGENTTCGDENKHVQKWACKNDDQQLWYGWYPQIIHLYIGISFI